MGGGGYTTQTPCYGTDNGLIDNHDMKPDTPVKVLDATGTIIGSTTLGPGEYKAGAGGVNVCVFTIDMKLDAKSKHYQLVIADREPYDFNDPSAVDLSLG